MRAVKKIKVGVVIYKEESDGETWYIAVEPLSGVQAQGKSVDEAIERVREEIKKIGDAWCESEVREAIDAKLIGVEAPQ